MLCVAPVRDTQSSFQMINIFLEAQFFKEINAVVFFLHFCWHKFCATYIKYIHKYKVIRLVSSVVSRKG